MDSSQTVDVDQALRAMMSIAVIGVSENPDSTAWQTAQFFQDEGCVVVPLHLTAKTVLGERVFRRLSEVPAELAIDTVMCFVRGESESLNAIVTDTIGRGGVIAFWQPEGDLPDQWVVKLRAAGIAVFNGVNAVEEYQQRTNHGMAAETEWNNEA